MTKIDLTGAGVSRRSFIAASAALAAALGLGASRALAADEKVASSDAADAKDAASSDAAEEVTFPITIKHALGETVIESKPERVACVGWLNQDTVIALGIAPVGFSAANYGVEEGQKMLPWTQEALEKLGVTDPVTFDDTDGVDFEAVSDTQPDIILCAYSGITQEDYDKLSKIAPTVAYPEAAWITTWRDQTSVEAQALGMKAEGDKLIADCEALIAEKLADHPALAGKTCALLNVPTTDFSSFYVYLYTDPRGSYLKDLGLELPQSLLDLTKDETSFCATVSSELADQVSDLDLAVIYGDEAFLAELQADALLGTIPAIKNGACVMLEGTTALAGSATASILSIPATIDEYLAQLDAAAQLADAAE